MQYATFIAAALAIVPLASALPRPRHVMPRQYSYGYSNTTSSSSGSCTSINTLTYDDLKVWEGAVSTIYTDQVGQQTVGVGHLCQQPNCAEVPYSIPLSDADMESLLNSDLQTYIACVSGGLSSTVSLNGNQFGALVSFAFNQGCGTWDGSTIKSRLNNGEDPDTVASEDLPNYTYSNGVFVQDLVTRRANEVTLFTTATSDAGFPC